MNMKINTICFILLFFFLICAVSATDNQNETLQQKQPEKNHDLCQINVESNTAKVESKKVENEKLERSIVCSLLPASAYKTKISMKAPDVKMFYKDGQKYQVTLKDSKKQPIKNAKVKISINGQTYTKTTNSNGIASLSLNLKSGTYVILAAFDGSLKYHKQSVKSTATIKSTIKCSDLTKYFKNTAPYCVTFYDKKGKLLKDTSVKFKLNSKSYTFKTNKNGIVKISADLTPGKYSISSINTKTSETITKTITIKNIVETNDLTMNANDGSKFKVKILNSNGKASPNKKVTFILDGRTYTKTTDKNGIASLEIYLTGGKYKIITEYEGLSYKNTITVKQTLKDCSFSHVTLIPSYVNVTTPYVFHNAAYALKTGSNGIIKMPKNEILNIQISETQSYLFSNTEISGLNTTVIGYKTHLVPFDGSGIKSDYNRNNLKGDGILISRNVNETRIEYRSTTTENSEMFGVYYDAGYEESETMTYLQNDRIKARIKYMIYSYDETGIRLNLQKSNVVVSYDFHTQTYQLLYNDVYQIKFANTNESVRFNSYKTAISGSPSKDDIQTKFIVNGKEELEKKETISYGLGEKYRSTFGFEVLQSYAIINEKVTKNIVERWISDSSAYLIRYGIMHIYGMFLASLETVWLADEIATQYEKDFKVNWERSNTATVLGGINLDDTYLHILNADMGMKVNGNNQTMESLFRLINSINLPNIENYALRNVAIRYRDNNTNSIDNILDSVKTNNYSIALMGEFLYIMTENDKHSAIIINTTSGVSNVIIVEDEFIYKGAKINTASDCCSVGVTPMDILNGIKDSLKRFLGVGGDLLNKLFHNPQSAIEYGTQLAVGVISIISNIKSSLLITTTTNIISPMLFIQSIANKFKNELPDSEWHNAYDHFTFTRGGFLQGKKVFNIPKGNGNFDYVEVSINKDATLNRDDAIYISDGKTRKLTREETYEYFDDSMWFLIINLHPKYWHDSWRSV